MLRSRSQSSDDNRGVLDRASPQASSIASCQRSEVRVAPSPAAGHSTTSKRWPSSSLAKRCLTDSFKLFVLFGFVSLIDCFRLYSCALFWLFPLETDRCRETRPEESNQKRKAETFPNGPDSCRGTHLKINDAYDACFQKSSPYDEDRVYTLPASYLSYIQEQSVPLCSSHHRCESVYINTFMLTEISELGAKPEAAALGQALRQLLSFVMIGFLTGP